MSYYTEDQLQALGLARYGQDVRISNKASLYNCAGISIGNHVRIDDFCVLSAGAGGIDIGDHIHIAAYSSMIGAGKITLEDFCNISSRVSVYSSNDDYSGQSMTNPMVPAKFTNVAHAPVSIGRHVIVGSGSVILPGTTIKHGVAIGALSLVTNDCDEFGIYAGIPAKRTGERQRGLLDLEQQLRLSQSSGSDCP